MGNNPVVLPLVDIKEDNLISLLNKRHSCRIFSSKKLTLKEVSLLLWSSNGLRVDAKSRATRVIPSAGATYPLEIFLVVGEDSVGNLKEGVYYYDYRGHSLKILKAGDIRGKLSEVCLGQEFISRAAVSIVICARYSRTTSFYGKRGIRYVWMEAGHACQNIYLICASLGLGTVEVGAYNDEGVKRVLDLPGDLEVLSIMPVGHSA